MYFDRNINVLIHVYFFQRDGITIRFQFTPSSDAILLDTVVYIENFSHINGNKDEKILEGDF
jgi:hypothetical protein